MKEADLEWLRRQFIAAIASDEILFNTLVLKGGNALSLIHSIGLRASVDIDYSTETEIPDPDGFGTRILRALEARLASHGYVLLDGRFGPRPPHREPHRDRWGGYTATFKLIEKGALGGLGGDLERSRRQSIPVVPNPQGERTFRIEISNYEYCEAKETLPVEGGTTCWVYTPDMIAAEKLRALCQQMTEYGKRVHPAPRARDFYDLHALVTEGRVELSEQRMHELVHAVFAAKEVPLHLLGSLEEYREFHRADWPSVQASIPGDRYQEYDFYVDFVVAEVRKLEPLWIVDSP